MLCPLRIYCALNFNLLCRMCPDSHVIFECNPAFPADVAYGRKKKTNKDSICVVVLLAIGAMDNKLVRGVPFVERLYKDTLITKELESDKIAFSSPRSHGHSIRGQSENPDGPRAQRYSSHAQTCDTTSTQIHSHSP